MILIFFKLSRNDVLEHEKTNFGGPSLMGRQLVSSWLSDDDVFIASNGDIDGFLYSHFETG